MEASDADDFMQKTRGFLRSRFLHLISNLTGGKECEVQMYENTHVKCKIAAFDPKFENVVVEDLETPLPVPIKKAILRTNDIISMKLDVNI